MKTLLTILLLFFACNIYAQRTGYLVVIQARSPKVEMLRTQDKVRAEALIRKHVADFRVETHMVDKLYYQKDFPDKTVYIEKKRVTKKGKYRKIR